MLKKKKHLNVGRHIRLHIICVARAETNIYNITIYGWNVVSYNLVFIYFFQYYNTCLVAAQHTRKVLKVYLSLSFFILCCTAGCVCTYIYIYYTVFERNR